MNNNVEVVTLVYKSLDYLEFIVNQLKSDLCTADGWDVGVRVVANDATQEVLDRLATLDIPYSIFNNTDPDEFYLNRVYGAYNYAVESSEYDNVVLVNSDDRFSKGWLSNLLKHHDGTNIPCSRLIESGKMASGMHGVNLGSNHFGRHPNQFDDAGWEAWVEQNSIDHVGHGGLYMPCLVEKQRFIEAGMFPRGNVFLEQDGTIVAGYPNDRPVFKAGDDFFFHDVLEAKYGMRHITPFDSLVYHIIEGEKDS